MNKTATHQLADLKLGKPLAEYVKEKREAGVSWRRITLDLRDDIDLDVTYESLRAWFPEQIGDGAP